MTGIVMGIALMALVGWTYADPINYGDTRKGDKFYNPGKSVE